MTYPTKKLGKVCKLYQPKTISKKEMIDDGKYVVFGANGIIGRYNDFNHENEEILITCRGATCGSINISNKYSWINGNAMVSHIINNEKLDFLYLFYCFKNIDFSKVISGSAQPQITRVLLVDLDIPIPNLPTQKLIVQKLDSAFKNIDESINITKKNIENIEELNKSVLGEVFKGYDYEKISNLIEKGTKWNPKNIGNETFEYIDISSIDNKNYILTETKKIKGNDAPSRAKQLVIKNDIIFATTRPNLKNIAIIDLDIDNLTSSTGFCVLRSIESKLYYKFLYYYIITDTFFDKLSPLIRGAQYPAVSDKDLKGLKIPLPPLEKQKEIVSYLDKVFEKNKVIKEGYEKKLKELEEMKQSILKEAFEGRLVKE